MDSLVLSQVGTPSSKQCSARHPRRRWNTLPVIRMGLNSIDLIIIAVYLVGITLFGLQFRKKQRSLKDYFLADRNVPWWAIMLSIVAAETSTLTIISIPGVAYRGDLSFLQVVFGYVIGRFVIAGIFIPHYFRGDLFTAY